MLNRSASEFVVAELCVPNVDAVRRRVREMRQRNSRREIESLRFLLWWLRSYLHASRIRPDLCRKRLNARNYLLQMVEDCIIRAVGDSLPAPGLDWSAEKREEESRKRAAAVAVHLVDASREQPLDDAGTSGNFFPRVYLIALQQEILAAWEREEGLYGGEPLSLGLIRRMQLDHSLNLVWGIRR